jgi:hypothetical protein
MKLRSPSFAVYSQSASFSNIFKIWCPKARERKLLLWQKHTLFFLFPPVARHQSHSCKVLCLRDGCWRACVCVHVENVCLCEIASPYPFGIIEFSHQKGVKSKIARGGTRKSKELNWVYPRETGFLLARAQCHTLSSFFSILRIIPLWNTRSLFYAVRCHPANSNSLSTVVA